MTSGQLAARMGLSQSAISQLERSEVSDRIQLDSLRRAAAELDCDLVYALVPMRGSLDATIGARARVLAARDLAASEGDDAHADVIRERIDHVAGRLASSGRLWDDRDL